MKKRVRVAILGAGPSALLAAEGVTKVQEELPADIDIRIISHGQSHLELPQKSKLGGAQFLHESIPYVTKGDGTLLQYVLVGDAEGYRRKVYGDEPITASVSHLPPDLTQRAWNLREVYDELWDRWAEHMWTYTFDDVPKQMPDLLDSVDLVFTTIPAPALCVAGHGFTNVEVHIGEPTWELPENTVVYNGNPDIGWYRESNLWGHRSVEYPSRRRPPLSNMVLVRKPLATNCNCWPAAVRLGRYGTWTKGELVNHAYRKAYNVTKGFLSAL